jgi:hypothetical protein
MSGIVQGILLRAESVGIRLRLDGDKLKATLPDTYDQRVMEVVEQLRLHRDQIRDFLNQFGRLPQRKDDASPSDPCYTCGGNMYWRRATGGYVCAECHPDPRWIPASKKIQ